MPSRGAAPSPTWGPALTAPARTRFSIQLRELPGGAIGVSAKVDGKDLAAETAVHPGRWMGSMAEMASTRHRELQKLGDAIGRIVFTGDIYRELAARMTEAVQPAG
jgi:hypothetical protein